MTYVSKKERVFDLSDHDDSSTTSLVKSSDNLLKIFAAGCEKGPATSEDIQKYRQICKLLNGKEMNDKNYARFKYIPVDVLITILMAEKDAYIQELRDKQEKCTCGGQSAPEECGKRLFQIHRSDECEDDKEAIIRKDAEMLALKNRNAVLESELDECRDTLTEAMHKLENFEDILKENSLLSDKLKRTDEMITLLEESKKALELQLKNHVCSNEEIIWHDPNGTPDQADWGEVDGNRLHELNHEREVLKQKVEALQKELFQARTNIQEVEHFKIQSQAIFQNLQEISRENQFYKKGTKKLKRCMEDLKNQAYKLKETYKRESLRANEQEKNLTLCVRQLQMLQEENENLQTRVKELYLHESEYYSMQRKLNQATLMADKSEALSSKLTELDGLVSENERLRAEILRLKQFELNYDENKESMVQMQNVLEAQKNEIRGLKSQIEILTHEYVEQKEYNLILMDVEQKEKIIMQNEEQLKEIPNLQSQINFLQDKLQKCLDDLKCNEKSSHQLQDELKVYKEKCHELGELLSTIDLTPDFTCIMTREEKEMGNKEEYAAFEERETDSISRIELTKTERLDDGDKNSEEVRSKRNLVEQGLKEILARTHKFKDLLRLKDERIKVLEADLEELKNSLTNCTKCQDLRNYSTKLENDILTFQEVNKQLEDQLRSKSAVEGRMEMLENTVNKQEKAVEVYKRLLRESEGKLLSELENRKIMEITIKLSKEEAQLYKKEIYTKYFTEIEGLKGYISFLRKLIDALREENQILQNMKAFTQFTGKKAMETLMKKLQAELLLLKNLTKPELEAECKALHAEVKRLVDEGDDLKLALEGERKAKDQLEKELSLIQTELTMATKNKGNFVPAETQTQTIDYTDQSEEIKKTLNDIKILKKENDEFLKEIAILQGQCAEFEREVTILQNNVDEMNNNMEDEKSLTNLQKEEINSLKERIEEFQREVTDLKTENEKFKRESTSMNQEITTKEAEVDRTKKELNDLKNEILKLNSEMEVLKNKLEDPEEKCTEDKEETEDIMLKAEKEFEELRKKLESCTTTEEKLTVLKTKRDNLIVKVNCFESEVDFLMKKLIECDLIKTELEQLKAEKQSLKNLQMTIENEEKLLSDIFGLREQLKSQQNEIEKARSENANLKEKLHDLGNELESCKKLHNMMSEKATETEVGAPITKRPNNDCKLDETDTVRFSRTTTYEHIGNTVSIDEFKLEIAKIESEHKHKVQKLEKGNAEKIRLLIMQHEEESKNRKKAYNDNINNIKSKYDIDIKKLAEKHKLSILRLQNLHEDHVQELITNYETEMETMQTVNENVVNDLTSGAVENCKLTEKHNKEIKDIELKFQKLLKEKENQHMIEMTSLEEKHSRELEKRKKVNLKRTKIMRHKYEDLLMVEKKKYEQLQTMLEHSKMGQQVNKSQDLKFAYLKPSHSESSSDFNKILQKIMVEGLESLNFEELMIVHCKTCFVAEGFSERRNTIHHEGDLIGDGCPHMSLLKEEKEELLKRIFILENEIEIIQWETHKAILNMENTEKSRIEEINNLLRNEREKNEELKKLLTNQSRAQTDLKIESYMLDRQASLQETKYVEKVKELEVERAEKRCLESDLEKERNNSKHLSLMLDNERQRFMSQHRRDSEYIEAMSTRLKKALSHEQKIESELHYEAQCRTKLELELQSLQRSFNLILQQPHLILDQPPRARSLESKIIKDRKNLDQFQSEKEEKLSKCKSVYKVKSHKNS